MLPYDAATINLLSAVGYAALGLVCGTAVSILLSVIMRIIIRRNEKAKFVSKRLKLRQRITLVTLGAGLGITYATLPSVAGGTVHWRPAFQHAFEVAMILACGWLLTGVLGAVEDGLVARSGELPDSPHARRLQTQMQMLNRVGSAVIWLIAVASALYTFDGFRIVGTSLFASAGVVSIVAGLAAQSSLSNLFAGIQLAFSDALRVGDSVVVMANGVSTNGRIEELTLTYVVVRVWDDRRVVMPSTFFTTTGFENWSRRDPEMLGTVEFDLDWMVPVEAMRAEFKRQLSDMDLWDGRVGVFQVTDTVGTYVRVRALVSARNSGDLFDLRCAIREGMVDWLQNTVPYALPRVRMEPRPTSAPSIEKREELTEQTKKHWEDKQAADESQDAVVTQFIDLDQATHHEPRKQKSIYGSTRRTGWKRPKRHNTAHEHSTGQQPKAAPASPAGAKAAPVRRSARPASPGTPSDPDRPAT